MRSDAQKRADLKYRQSEKGKAINAHHEQTPKGKITRARYGQSRKGKVAYTHGNARYRRTFKGKMTRIRTEAKRRNLGYNPINNWFPGSHGHHIDKENVLFIPSELHNSISHKQDNPESMQRMNNAAFEWFYIEEVI